MNTPNRMCYVHTMEHVLARKKEDVRVNQHQGMNLENLLLNKGSQTQKDACCGFHFMRYLEQADPQRQNNLVFCQELGQEDDECLLTGTGFLCVVMAVIGGLITLVVAQDSPDYYVKTVSFMLEEVFCELYLSLRRKEGCTGGGGLIKGISVIKTLDGA